MKIAALGATQIMPKHDVPVLPQTLSQNSGWSYDSHAKASLNTLCFTLFPPIGRLPSSDSQHL